MEGHLGQCWTSQLMLREANDVGILWVIWEYPKYARQSTLLKLISGYLRMIHDESLIYKPSFSHRTLEILQRCRNSSSKLPNHLIASPFWL
jgi:hypothetical protein